MRKITADFTASHDKDLGDALVRLEHNESQATVLHFSWDELEQLVQAGQRLLEKRQSILSTPKALLTELVPELEDDAHEYYDACGHFHPDHREDMSTCPAGTPCGDYRCCIN